MRYLVNFDSKDLSQEYCDVIVIGSGIAGLYTALNINPKRDVLVLAKGEIQKSNSYFAQGGVAAAISTCDSPQLHSNDTVKAGAGQCNLEAVNTLVDEALLNIENLLELGVDFDKDANGDLTLTMEGGHSLFRVIHANGDSTGQIMVDALMMRIYERENVTVKDNTFLIEILSENGLCQGVLVLENGALKIYRASSVVIATGGIGQVYEQTTNPPSATGDGIAAALRAGAEIIDMEFIQFHPTVLYHKENKSFLISEALRGEGAILRNTSGERFMDRYHTKAELAPRDIVSRAVKEEMDRTNSRHVYLDITHKDPESTKQRFPNIYNSCLRYGINITKQWIPVAPAQHYLMGGIKTDLNGKTSLEKLYACGECSCTGVHGANRLASNSLLECIVFGRRIGIDINTRLFVKEDAHLHYGNYSNQDKNFNVKPARQNIQKWMTSYASVVKKGLELSDLKNNLRNLKLDTENCKFTTVEEFESYNILMIADLIVDSAMSRKENIGSHYMV